MKTQQDVYDKLIKRTVNKDGCWIWQGSKNNKGYPHMRVQCEWWLVHRYVYTHIYGPIPFMLIVRHTCDRRDCINPHHLLIGTHLDNVHDQIERGRLKPPLGKCKPIGWYR